MKPLTQFKEKNKTYIETLWTIALIIGYLRAIIYLLSNIFASIVNHDVVSFIFLILFNSILMIFWGVIYGIFIFAILFIVTSIPYFVIKGVRT